jgi:hypothetical protein
MRILPSANPSRYQHRDPSVVTTCAHTRCRNVRKPGPRPMSARSCPASTMDATIGQGFGHRMSGRIWSDTVHSTRHAMANRKRRGQERTNGMDGVRTSSIATTTRRPARTRRAPPVGRRLQLGNQGWPGDGKTANATVTTAATRQLLGVALPSKPRLGALLSCVGVGWYEGRAMGLRKGEVCRVGLVRAC